jgi:uncharacterized protein (UPF0276 family)
MSNTHIETVGFGLGLREQHHRHILNTLPKIDWFEIISENYMESDGKHKQELEKIREHYPIAMHGVGMSIGTIDPLNSDYFTKLQALIDWLDPLWVSDHVCWTGVAHKNTHDLLPLPYTEESLNHLVTRIDAVQTALKRTLVLENPSTYLEFKSSYIPEAEFLAEMVKRSGCELLLDANNIYVSCFNHRLSTKDYVNALPLEAVRSIHLAGHEHKGTHIVDTHNNYVSDDVWALYHHILKQAGRVPNTMIEWDADIPTFEVYAAELDKAKKVAQSQDNAPHVADFSQGETIEDTPTEASTYPEELARLQDAILRTAHKDHKPDLWIVPKKDFAAKDQLSVYIMAYRFRLYDVVFEEYPVLKIAMGHDAFDRLLKDMVNTVYSQNYNLAQYIAALPDFLRQHSSGTAFFCELAELEKIVSTVQNKKQSPFLDMAEFQRYAPEDIANLTFEKPNALSLQVFEYPVNAYYTQVVNGETAELPSQSKSYVAIYRSDSGVWRSDLDEAEYKILQAIYNGLSLSHAIETQAHNQNTQDNIQLWLGKWLQNGFLACSTHLQTNKESITA